MLSEENNKGFGSEQKEDLKKLLLSFDSSQSDLFFSLIKEIKNVDTEGKGSSSDSQTLSDEETIDKKAKEYAKENKVSYSDALREVS